MTNIYMVESREWNEGAQEHRQVTMGATTSLEQARKMVVEMASTHPTTGFYVMMTSFAGQIDMWRDIAYYAPDGTRLDYCPQDIMATKDGKVRYTDKNDQVLVWNGREWGDETPEVEDDKERIYLVITNLARVRDTLMVMRDILPGFDGITNPKDKAILQRILKRWEDGLSAAYQKTTGDDDDMA